MNPGREVNWFGTNRRHCRSLTCRVKLATYVFVYLNLAAASNYAQGQCLLTAEVEAFIVVRMNASDYNITSSHTVLCVVFSSAFTSPKPDLWRRRRRRRRRRKEREREKRRGTKVPWSHRIEERCNHTRSVRERSTRTGDYKKGLGGRLPSGSLVDTTITTACIHTYIVCYVSTGRRIYASTYVSSFIIWWISHMSLLVSLCCMGIHTYTHT
jgi:hypothetical protein